MLKLTLAPLPLIGNPLIADVVERTRTIRFQILMVLAKVESSAGASGRIIIKLSIPNDLTLTALDGLLGLN